MFPPSPPPPRPPAGPAAPPASDAPAPEPPLRVLVAEDDAALREAVLAVFEPFFGLLDLLEARHGGEAVKIVRAERIDLAVLDFRMPQASGLEAFAELRRVNPAAPGILVSAEADEDLRRDAREQHVHAVLGKPFARRDLLGAADSALRHAYRIPLRPAA